MSSLKSYSDSDTGEPKQTGISPCKRYIKYDEILGKGGMKIVYRSLDTKTGLPTAWCELVDKRQSLYREAVLHKSLRHINILRFRRFWDITTGPNIREVAIITELMNEGSLRKYVRRCHPLNQISVQSICRQVLNGLNYLHTCNPPIIHRDIKCDNLFISNPGEVVKIGDFGLSIQKTGNVRGVVGTPEFMAPELYEEEYDKAIDVYAFGMCLAELTTGKYPYEECKTFNMVFRTVSRGFKPDIVINMKNGTVRTIIEWCIQYYSQDRPTCAELLASNLMKGPFTIASNDDDESLLGAVGVVGYDYLTTETSLGKKNSGPLKTFNWDLPQVAPILLVKEHAAVEDEKKSELSHSPQGGSINDIQTKLRTVKVTEL